jgi:hypothetical protein
MVPRASAHSRADNLNIGLLVTLEKRAGHIRISSYGGFAMPPAGGQASLVAEKQVIFPLLRRLIPRLD